MAAWSHEQIALLRKLWADDWSAGKIAEELGRTRNAVMGFAHRNRDICPKRGSGTRPLNELPRDRRAAPKPRLPDVPKPPPPPPAPDDSVAKRPQSSAKADLYRMLQRAVINTGGRL